LQAAKELKAIKDEKFFNNLLERINKAEKQSPVQQKTTLGLLSRELKAKSGKGIHPQVCAILGQDIQTLLRNLK
jgi:hypothetical protein